MPRPGQACLPQQAGGQLPGLAGVLAWALGGAGARARRCFPASSWKEMKTPEKEAGLDLEEARELPRPVPGFPVRDTDADGKAGPLIVSTGRRGEGAM